MSWLGDQIKGLGGSVSGTTNQANYELQLQNQIKSNEALLQLERERIALENSPEAIKAKQQTVMIVVGLFVFVIAASVFLFIKFGR